MAIQRNRVRPEMISSCCIACIAHCILSFAHMGIRMENGEETRRLMRKCKLFMIIFASGSDFFFFFETDILLCESSKWNF